MWQAPRYRGINRVSLYSSKARQSSRLGLAALRAGDLLAVLCLSFGTVFAAFVPASLEQRIGSRSEEHTSELQSHLNLVCRLLLEKKKDAARRRGTSVEHRSGVLEPAP